jgi:flagellar basal body-associated protein FliL
MKRISLLLLVVSVVAVMILSVVLFLNHQAKEDSSIVNPLTLRERFGEGENNLISHAIEPEQSQVTVIVSYKWGE